MRTHPALPPPLPPNRRLFLPLTLRAGLLVEPSLPKLGIQARTLHLPLEPTQCAIKAFVVLNLNFQSLLLRFAERPQPTMGKGQTQKLEAFPPRIKSRGVTQGLRVWRLITHLMVGRRMAGLEFMLASLVNGWLFWTPLELRGGSERRR